jgi:hypothetical protein
MTNLTGETITRSQIRDLGIRAFESGDMTTFDLTVAALDWDTSEPHTASARRCCADKINASESAKQALYAATDAQAVRS